jgi:hypothetical protein
MSTHRSQLHAQSWKKRNNDSSNIDHGVMMSYIIHDMRDKAQAKRFTRQASKYV